MIILATNTSYAATDINTKFNIALVQPSHFLYFCATFRSNKLATEIEFQIVYQ